VKILGLNLGELSTAAILVDGEIAACVSEERFSRIKNDESYPKRAIEYCLETAGIKGDELDYVAIASQQADLWHRITHYYSRFTIGDYIREQHEYWYPRLYKGRDIIWQDLFKDKWDFEQYPGRWGELVKQMGESYYLSETEQALVNDFIHETIFKHIGCDKSRIVHVDHHSGHSAYAYYSSPFRGNKALVITMDAYGDGLSATTSVANNDKIFRKKSIQHDAFQLARMYRYATLILGMKPNEHEYKVMGLAPYGKEYESRNPYRVYSDTMYVNGTDFHYHNRPRDMYFYFREKLEGNRFDGIAGGLQKYTEEIVSQWIGETARQEGIKTVVVSGGVAMNVKAMKCIGELAEVENLFVPPSSGDESLAIGSCFHVCVQQFGVNPAPIKHVYLGPDISVREEKDLCEKIIRADKPYRIEENVNEEVIVQKLIEGRIVARCRGQMEFGARALGNRSILADPRSRSIVSVLNDKVKSRDFWMPFAPSVIEDSASENIVNDKGFSAPFMTIAFDTTKKGAKDLAAGVHPCDGTVRPQVIPSGQNPDYEEIIRKFRDKTGVGGILNTSFNLHGKPIVCDSKDAFRVFELTDIDDLLIGSTLISKIK
jgi:carbamoyltransferase